MITQFINGLTSLPGNLLSEGDSGGSTNAVDRLSEQPGKIRRQRSQAVLITGGSLIALYLLVALTSHFFSADQAHDHRRCLLLITGSLVTAAGLWLARRHRSTEGMWVICFGILALYVILQIAVQTGIRSGGTYVLLLFVPLSGFVGGLRSMQPVFTGVMATLLLTYLLEKSGFIIGQAGRNVPPLEMVLFCQTFVCVGLYMLARVIGESLDLLANLPHESNRVISHELRQPLSTVVAAVQVLSHPHLSDAMRARTLKSLSNATSSMMSLLDDIADHGKLASGDMELFIAPFSPAAITHEVFGMYESAAQQKGVTPRCRIEIDERAVLLGDGGRLSQVLSNLMSNAVKYTEHGEVTLIVSGKIHAEDTDVVKVRYTVMDTGVGIPKDKQRQIFTAFSKGDEERFNQPGMGLGLSIAKHLVAAMNGKIGFESTGGRGSQFWIEISLPLAGAGSSIGSTAERKHDSVIPLPLNKNRSAE